MKLHLAGMVAASALALAACDSNNTPGTAPGMGALQVVNAVSDSQPIDASVANVSSDLQNIAFTNISGFQDIPEGSYKVQMTTNYNGTQVQLEADNVSIDHNNQTTVFAVGNLTLGNQGTLVVEQNVSGIDSSKTQVQFVDVAGADGTIALYTPGTATPVATANLSAAVNAIAASNPSLSYSQPAQIAAGSYQIIVTVAGVPIFNSGATNLVKFTGGVAERLIVFNDLNVGNGSAIEVWQSDSQNNKVQIQPGT